MRVDVLGKITESVLAGLVYLYEAHRIMHRDIKPSNILLNSRGNIKLCDFGVATETVNSIADTFVGTSTYMAPERIQGGAYTVRSDVWSVGLSVMELAVGRFPFDSSDSAAGNRASAGPMGILDLLQQIVHEPAPKLPKSDAFPPILHEFVAKCLLKKSEERPTPRELYVRFFLPFFLLPRIKDGRKRKLMTKIGPRCFLTSSETNPRGPRRMGNEHDEPPQPQIAPRPCTSQIPQRQRERKEQDQFPSPDASSKAVVVLLVYYLLWQTHSAPVAAESQLRGDPNRQRCLAKPTVPVTATATTSASLKVQYPIDTLRVRPPLTRDPGSQSSHVLVAWHAGFGVGCAV